jgi:hypothetical protein
MKYFSFYKLAPLILTLLAIFSFFYGFYVDEISMGAGGFNGDFKFVKKSINLFSENSIKDSIMLFSESSNRPPLIYILHKLFNPLFANELGFRKVVFAVSLSVPIIFYFCLKERFEKIDKSLLLLLSSIIFFNPFFRTSSYWGLEENYAIISTLASLLFLLKLSNNKKKNSPKIFLNIFFVTLFSSLSIYFDQKFLIIPLICFLKIISENYLTRYKLFTLLLYFILSIPYLFLIKLWGGVFPSNIYHVGKQFYFHHFGYALTMIAFIFFPFIFLKSANLKDQFHAFLKNQKFFILLIPILTYLIVLLFFYNDNFFDNKLDGGGIIKKISLIIFPSLILKKIFITSSIFISWFFIFLFFEQKSYNLLLTTYFLFFAIIVKPFYQEYYDPIIFFLILFVYKINFKLSFSKVYYLYAYFLIFLIGVNFYYN